MTPKTSLRPVRATAGSRCARVAALVLAMLAPGWWSAGIAQAAPSAFTLSPVSGPTGTNVNVSGAGCAPGLTLSSSDFVSVAAPSLAVTVQVPVAASGSWHGTFVVPPTANAGPAPVLATCVSDALPSLTTVYTPQMFTVTTAPTTTTGPTLTTTPTTPGGTPGTTTPGTATPKGGSGGPTPTTRGGPPDSSVGSNPSSTVPTSNAPSGGSNGGAKGGGAGAGSSKTGTRGTTDGGRATRRVATAARAADLNAPELPIAHLGDSSAFGWLAWTLLILLVVAAIGAPLWLRRLRRRNAGTAVMGEAL